MEWDHYFSALRKYLDYYRQRDNMPVGMRGLTTGSFPSIHRGAGGVAGAVADRACMSEQELAGLVSITQLITSIAEKDPEARRLIHENRHWNCVENCVGLLACAIPLVLKGHLYRFLAALAIDEAAAIHVWNCMLCERIAVLLPDGRLAGVQQDLEDQECALRAYDCSQGYLHLLRELFTHKTRPAARQLEPHLLFITKSILCQYAQRSYSDVQQMWEMVKLGFDCLYELLGLFYVTQASVAANVSEVQILTQLLNHTPLYNALIHVLLECADHRLSSLPTATATNGLDTGLVDHLKAAVTEKKNDAAFSAIRLLYTALSNRSALADAVRSNGSTLIIASMDGVLFWPIAAAKHGTTCLSLLGSFLSESESLAKHAFYVMRILRVATAQCSAIQPRLVQILQPQGDSLVHAATTISSAAVNADASAVELSQFDLVPLDVEQCTPARLRGELIRHLFEMLVDAMEANSGGLNLAYLMLGFNLHDIGNSQFCFTDGLVSVGQGGYTALHNILDLVLQLATTDQPFSLPHSALFEPALRLLLKLSSYNSASSTLILRHMRSYHDMVYKLATCTLFRQTDAFTDGKRRLKLDKDAEYGMLIAVRSIQAVILELIALELASLLRHGHIENPKAFMTVLFNTASNTNTPVALDFSNGDSQQWADTTTSFCGDSTADREDKKALLWTLLEQSRVDVGEIAVPDCQKFAMDKIDDLLRHCIVRSTCNVDQYDVEYVHLLLNTEVNSIVNADIATIKEEARLILDYCARRNAAKLLQGACVHLVSGWLAVVNVLAVYAPVPFIEPELHYTVMVDALFLLKEYCLSVETSSELSAMLGSSIFRVIRALCNLSRFILRYGGGDVAREALFPMLHLLLQCLVLPGYSKSSCFKTDIYGACLCLFEAFSAASSGPPAAEGKTLTDEHWKQPSEKSSSLELSQITERERNIGTAWGRIFPAMAPQVVATLISDINFAPASLKVVAASVLSELIHEDRYRGRSVVKELVASGSYRCVLDMYDRSEEGSEFKTQLQRVRDEVERLLQ